MIQQLSPPSAFNPASENAVQPGGKFLKRDNEIWSGQVFVTNSLSGLRGTKEQQGDSRNSCFVSNGIVDEDVSDQFT